MFTILIQVIIFIGVYEFLKLVLRKVLDIRASRKYPKLVDDTLESYQTVLDETEETLAKVKNEQFFFALDFDEAPDNIKLDLVNSALQLQGLSAWHSGYRDGIIDCTVMLAHVYKGNPKELEEAINKIIEANKTLEGE